MKMKKQFTKIHQRPKNNNRGPNKNSLKDQKAKNKPLKFLNDIKKTKDVKPLVEKVLGQGKVVTNPGNSPKKNKNKNKMKNQKSKKGKAPLVNPDIDNAVTEERSDEEMIEVNSSGAESPASSPKKNKNKKKKLGLLASKRENKENGDANNEEDEKVDKNATPNAEGKEKQPKKFCLFVGNLPYDVTEEQVREHFKSLKDGLKDVRLMTHQDSGKGKGFCFIELLNSVAYQAGLKLNKQKMGDRVIRVEYTTPGKADNRGRKKFIHHKTKKLLGQKQKRKGKGFNKKKGKGKK